LYSLFSPKTDECRAGNDDTIIFHSGEAEAFNKGTLEDEVYCNQRGHHQKGDISEDKRRKIDHVMKSDLLTMHTMDVGSARVAYFCAGHGPAVVLLHGLSGSSHWWSRNVPALAKYFRVYTVDLIGFGSSRGQRFALADAPGTIISWMDRLEEERFTIIGHSMGGFIAASTAMQRPEQVEKLVLVDAVALPFGRSVMRSALSLLESIPYMSIDFYPILALDALRAGPVTLLRAIWDIHHQTSALEPAQIRAKTLVIWGENDRLIPLKSGMALHQGMPGAKFSMIRRAGHIPMWDQAAEFNQILIRFLLSAAREK
jgi:pimeloyl-ACP methyl ester carboxylesterase